MVSLLRTLKFVIAIVAAVAFSSVQSFAQHPGTGTVRLNIVKAGFIVGVGGGSGVGSLGVASVALVGTASNLRSPYDIAGTYGAAGAGATFVGGGQVVTLQNEKGVVLRLSGPQVGFQVSLGLAGLTIAVQ